jgi:hypothetical protein
MKKSKKNTSKKPKEKLKIPKITINPEVLKKIPKEVSVIVVPEEMRDIPSDETFAKKIMKFVKHWMQ